MIKLIATLVAEVGSYGGLLSLYLTIKPLSSFEVIDFCIVLVGILFTLIFAIADIVRYTERKSKTYRKDSKNIAAFMHKWIETGGRVVISTRDMSWANEKTKKMLIEKSRKRELIVCLPAMIPIAEQLQKEGAEIYAYGCNGFGEPKSRFTITHYGSDSEHIAIGKTIGSHHVIDRYCNGDHPITAVANDFVKLVMQSTRD